MNGSNSSPPCGPNVINSDEIVAKTIAYSAIGVLGLIGNIMTIVVVWREKSLHNTVNYLIVNMAISDLIIPLITLPHIIYNELGSKDFAVWNVNGDFGTAWCKIYFFLTDWSPTVSILCLVIITVDRFCAIMFPLRAGLAPFNCANRVLIVLIWIVPALFLVPNLYSYQLTVDSHNEIVCTSLFSDDPKKDYEIKKIIYTVMFFFFVILPFFALTVMYTMILLKLRQQDRSAMAMSQSKKDRRLRFRKTRRVVFMALTVIIVFAMCWIPLNTLAYLLYYHWKPTDLPHLCYLGNLVFAVKFLPYSNPMFNPVIYFIFIEKFRKGLLNCFTCHNRNRLQQTVIHSDGRENAAKSLAIFDGGSPLTRVSSGTSLQLQTHKF